MLLNKKRNKILLTLLGFLLLVIFYGIGIEPYWIEVKHLNIEHEKLNKVLKDKTAVHIADLHIGKMGIRERKILKRIEEIKPDMIFISRKMYQIAI